MLEASCHCGAVRLAVPSSPEFMIECNCSLCRRNAALWAFYEADAVQVSGHPEHTAAYVWGDRTIRTIHCRMCGCVTHWEPIRPKPNAKLSVNMRMFEPTEIEGVRVRKFDGADSWQYVD